MKKYLIEDVKAGATKGGMACGPVGGAAVASVKVNDGNKSEWWTIEDVEGIPTSYITEEDVFEKIIEDRFEDELVTYMNNSFVSEIAGIAFGENFYELIDSLEENPNNSAVPVIRLMITLLTSDDYASQRIIEMTRGKYSNEVIVPRSVYEMDYLDEDTEYDYGEIRVFNPESNEGAWFPKMFAEMKIQENGEDRYIAVSAPPADKWWCYWVTDASVVDFEEKDEKNFEEIGEHISWDEFRPHILEEYNCIRDLIEHRYLKEFLYVIADAESEFDIAANFNE